MRFLSVSHSGADVCNHQWVEVPPWLWIWIPLYLAKLPDRVALLANNLATLIQVELGGSLNLVIFRNIQIAAMVAGMVPLALLALSILYIVVPQVRARALEREYHLKPYDTSYPSPALHAIVARLREVAPEVTIMVNIVETRERALIYPLGYRRNAVAVFGGLLMEWRRSPDVAEAILLHEVAHHRHGDALVVGAGSFIEYLVRFGAHLTLGFVMVPILWTAGTMILNGADWLAIFREPGLLAGLSSISLQMLFLGPALFLPPLTAIWTAELHADRFAFFKSSSPSSYRGWLAAQRPQPGIHSLLHRLSHPPTRLRVWFLDRAECPASLTIILVLFPLGYVVGFISLLVYAWGVGLAYSADDPFAFWRNLPSNLRVAIAAATPAHSIIAGSLILWPLSQLVRNLGTARLEHRMFMPNLALGAVLTLLIYGTYSSAPTPLVASVTTDKQTYRSGETIVVQLTVARTHPEDWVTLVPEQADLHEWGDWAFLRDAKHGQVRKRAVSPGAYEARLFSGEPEREGQVLARTSFAVAP